LRVACCQISPQVESPDRSTQLALDAISAAVAGGAELIVLPELANSGYVFDRAEEARTAAVPPGADLIRDWGREAAKGDAILVAGFCELAPDGRVFNSSVLVDGDQVLGVYRKLHLWGQEPKWFSAGEAPAPVISTRLGRIGLGVCYDIEFPELTRGLALDGAELIALPANWPFEEPAPGARPILHGLAAMTAYWSKVFVAVCDRCGTERGVEFEGGSVIAAPNGELLAGPVAGRGAEILYADCDLATAASKRVGAYNDAFADRRPEHYVSGLRQGRAGQR
jgi:5-aminopentanamidase